MAVWRHCSVCRRPVGSFTHLHSAILHNCVGSLTYDIVWHCLNNKSAAYITVDMHLKFIISHLCMSAQLCYPGNVSVMPINHIWFEWMKKGNRKEGATERWEDDKHFPSSSSRQEEAACLHKNTHSTWHTYASPHKHTHSQTQTHTKTLFSFVYMQITKRGCPVAQSVVGGHGKHIMALACNDTLLVYVRALVCRVWK